MNTPTEPNWTWPAGDTRDGGMRGWSEAQWIEYRTRNAERYALLNTRPTHRHTAVVAGAHIGIMPILYANHYRQVIAIEPDTENFECLLRNVDAHHHHHHHHGIDSASRIKCVQAGLSRNSEAVYFAHDALNSGKSHVATPREAAMAPPGTGTHVIDTLALDSLHLQALDLLQLDCEGYELHALDGATNHIRDFRPIIVVEMNGLGTRYGTMQHDILAFMHVHGYVEVEAARRGADRVFRHPDDQRGP